jgi:hypothetical protein
MGWRQGDRPVREERLLLLSTSVPAVAAISDRPSRKRKWLPVPPGPRNLANCIHTLCHLPALSPDCGHGLLLFLKSCVSWSTSDIVACLLKAAETVVARQWLSGRRVMAATAEDCWKRCFLCGPCRGYITRTGCHYERVSRRQLEE